MNPSLPSLQLTAGQPELLPGAATEVRLNQSDSGLSGDFPGLLGDAHTTLSSVAQALPPAPPGAERLPGELRTLPPDGKLLPLLERTLDRLADSGMDPQQFLERLNAKLKALAQNSELQPDERLAVALQQLIQEQPALESALPREALALAVGNKAAQQFLSGSDTGAASGDVAEQAKKAAEQPASVRPAQLNPTVQQSAASSFEQALPKEAKSATLDNVLSQLQQRPASPEQRAALMAAVKRMTADNRPLTAPVENAFRLDLAAPGVASSAPAAHAPAPGTLNVGINTPFGQAGWDQALSERIQWLAGQKVQGAQVKLNPANLGPMEVRIQVHNDQASVQFTAHHAVVRDALEAALPRLRDMFEASGVELVDVDVSSGGSFTEQNAMQDPSKPHSIQGYGDEDPALETRLETPLAAFAAQGRLDLFA